MENINMDLLPEGDEQYEYRGFTIYYDADKDIYEIYNEKFEIVRSDFGCFSDCEKFIDWEVEYTDDSD